MRPLSVPTLLAGLIALAGGTAVQAQWTTIKGQVVLPKAPKPEPVDVTTDKAFCLKDGPVLDESLLTGKTGGVKNLVVWLRPDTDKKADPFPADKIHPSLAKAAPVERVIDQPCCLFIPRITAARAGDTLLIKNSAKVSHNANVTGDPDANPGFLFNNNLPSGDSYKPKDALASQLSPITVVCNVHPWMKGFIRVFDHPYFAVTDDDGNFTIKDAPAGKWRLVIWHERGFHNGTPGGLGMPIEVKGEMLELPKITLDLKPKKMD